MIRYLCFWVMFAGLFLLQACATGTATKSDADSRAAAPAAEQASEAPEGFFVVPDVNFSRYARLLLADLNLEQIVIAGSTQPLVLTPEDKRFYRELYTAAVVDHLIADGTYATALDAEQDVLFVKAAITRVASPDLTQTAPAAPAMDAYLQSTSRITLALEMYDSLDEQVLATFTDTWDLGRSWDDNNHQIRVMQMRRAFDYWLAYVRQELDILSGRKRAN
jgi:hypothetical protein